MYKYIVCSEYLYIQASFFYVYTCILYNLFYLNWSRKGWYHYNTFKHYYIILASYHQSFNITVDIIEATTSMTQFFSFYYALNLPLPHFQIKNTEIYIHVYLRINLNFGSENIFPRKSSNICLRDDLISMFLNSSLIRPGMMTIYTCRWQENTGLSMY